MPHITVENANAWADQVKLNLGTLDSELEDSQAVQVLAGVAQAYDTSTWVDTSTTPALVKKIIAMRYVGWYFQRTYSEDDDISTYGILLINEADKLIAGIAAGTLGLPDAPGGVVNTDAPLFYPTDASSAMCPSIYDMSLGGAKFSMGVIW